MAANPEPRSYRTVLFSVGVLTACAILWPALLTFDPGDWPSPHRYPHHTPTANACGPVGSWCAYQLRYFIGDGAYPLLLFATLAGAARLVRGRIGSVWERIIGLAILIATTSASAHLISTPGTGQLPVGHGGLVGYAIGEVMRANLDRLGTLIVLASSLFVGLLFATEGWVLELPAFMRKEVGRVSGGALALARRAGTTATALRTLPAEGGITAEESEALLAPGGSKRRRARRRGKSPATDGESQPGLFDEPEDEPGEPTEAGDDEYEGETTEVDEVEHEDDEEDGDGTAASDSGPGRLAAVGPIVNFPTAQDAAAAEPYPRTIENWTLPSLELLQPSEYGYSAQQEVIVRRQAKVLEQTLEEFRLDAQVVEIDTGPVITMFELKLGSGIKVSQIATLSNDIARALKAHAIRVVAPISGKNTVGIEVPNVEKEKVRLHELMTLAGKRAQDMRLPLFLGKDAAGTPLVTDLTTMPHLLIAGTTGSGKSICLNAIVLSVLMTKRPDHVKMILIDPKMVEMSQFKGMPHLMSPIVTDLARAEKILEWAVTKMDERYELLAEARVKNIAGYNALGAGRLYERLKPDNEAEKSRIPVRIPYIVILIDELADLMMTAPREVEHHLSRLAQKSRAVGVHIIVATQRPEAKVVTGLIKSNLPSRICFRVASRMDSRIVLDQNGGEVLLGQGDMLFLPPGSHKLVRAQGTYLEESEIHAVLSDLTSRAEPEFHPELIRLRTPDQEDPGLARDPLFEQAVDIILQSQRGSVSLLQRRLNVGYSRASRLIDQMAAAGIVGDYKGSQAREVLVTTDQWRAWQKQVTADLGADYEADEDEEATLRPSPKA
jgi:S-DNA-T family DNA segregation ATPase FtsK/SpoIIIE